MSGVAASPPQRPQRPPHEAPSPAGAAAAPTTQTPEGEGGNAVDGVAPGDGPADIVLSLRNERYRDFMWGQFNLLGLRRDNARDERVGLELFTQFKDEWGVRNFYKVPKLGRKRTRVEEEEALAIITTHIKRRSESAHRWQRKSAKKAANKIKSPLSIGSTPKKAGDKPTPPSPAEGPAVGSRPGPLQQSNEAKPAASMQSPATSLQTTPTPEEGGDGHAEADATTAPAPKEEGQPSSQSGRQDQRVAESQVSPNRSVASSPAVDPQQAVAKHSSTATAGMSPDQSSIQIVRRSSPQDASHSAPLATKSPSLSEAGGSVVLAPPATSLDTASPPIDSQSADIKQDTLAIAEQLRDEDPAGHSSLSQDSPSKGPAVVPQQADAKSPNVGGSAAAEDDTEVRLPAPPQDATAQRTTEDSRRTDLGQPTATAAAPQPSCQECQLGLHGEEKKQDDHETSSENAEKVKADVGSSSIVTEDVLAAVPLPPLQASANGGCEGASPIEEEPKSDKPPQDAEERLLPYIILSLNEDFYREIMWKHYRILGKTRDTEREAETGSEIFDSFKQKLAPGGKFFKREGHAALQNDVEVDEEKALAKIIADIRRRMKNYRTWSSSPQKQVTAKPRTFPSPSSNSPRPKRSPSSHAPPGNELPSQLPPRRARRSNASAVEVKSAPPPKVPQRRSIRKPNSSATAGNKHNIKEADVVLSIEDEVYRDVMWTQYNILGRKGAGDNSQEVVVGKKLCALFVDLLGEGGRLLKKEKRGGVPSQVDEDGALQKITRDLKRRNETIQKWQGYKSIYNMSVPVDADFIDDSSEDSEEESEEEFIADLMDQEMDDPLDYLPSITEDYAWREQLAPSPIAAIDGKPTPLPPQPKSVQRSAPKPKTAVELLSNSHLGQRLPPLETIPFVKSVHTANQLVYALQHATYRLNELNGPRSKHAKKLRLYYLPELNEEYRPSEPKPPVLSQLAESMETTPKSLKKWFMMYKNAVERGFDFELLGKDKIKDHHGVFFGERYQFSTGGMREMEEYFLEAGKRIIGDAENSPSSMPDYNIFSGPPGVSADQWMDFGVDDLIQQTPISEKGAISIALESNEDQTTPSKSPFFRDFQRNEARMIELRDRINNGEEINSKLVGIKISTTAKRIKKGTKDRMLCMVEGCEKHAQTKCDGCCTAHYRILSTIPVKDQKMSASHADVSSSTLGKRKVGDVGVQPSIPRSNVTLDQLETGSRIYVEWEADHGLYKATVNKTFFDRETPMVKLHYDGKKRHILDTIPLGMVHSFIGSENVKKQKVAHGGGQTAGNEGLDGECQEVASINQAYLTASSGGVSYVSINRRNFASKLSPSSAQRDSAPVDPRSFITISPITVSQSGGDIPATTHAQPEQIDSMSHNSTSLAPGDSAKPSGGIASTRNGARSPKEVAAVNKGVISGHFLTSNGMRVNSAFTSPSRKAPPPLQHQLYQSPNSAPLGSNFPRVRSAGRTSQLQRSGGRARTSQKRDGPRKDTDGRSRPKRAVKPTPRFEVEESSSSRSKAASGGPTKSVLCHCPDCGKQDLTVQGIYAHYGRAHSAKVHWQSVTYSCPFCTGRTGSGRNFKSFYDVEAHVNAAHPGSIVQGPHPSKLSGQSKRVQNSSSTPKGNRLLRDRKPLPTDDDDVAEPVPRVQAPPSWAWSKLEYARLLPDGRKDYPSELFRVVDMIDEQCQKQEQEVEVAREQRAKLCSKETEAEAKALHEERLSYQRGIRERSSLADQERLEKLRYTERADEMVMRYEHEGLSKRHSQEEAERYKLCSRPIRFSNETTRQTTKQAKVCPDPQCQFCQKNKGNLQQLLLDSEINEFKVDAPATESPVFQRDTKVLDPGFCIVGDEHFLEAEEEDLDNDGKDASKSKRVNPSRRDASTAKRLKTEEEKLWVLRNTKHSLEFIKKYNEGMVTNAWGEMKKDSRGRKLY